MQYLIDLSRIFKIYNKGQGASEVRALDGVDLKVEPGEFLAVVGSSGSGKSTLMNILGCLDSPTDGKYLLDGKEVLKISDNKLSDIRREKIGFIFQGFNLIPTLNSFENVELPLIYRGIPKAKRKQMSLEALERVGLSDRLNHYPSELSGGQQQRVAIARAIASKPPLILADEPTGNLDRSSGKQVMGILLDLNKEGKTVILITHDNSIASQIPRHINICDGKIV